MAGLAIFAGLAAKISRAGFKHLGGNRQKHIPLRIRQIRKDLAISRACSTVSPPTCNCVFWLKLFENHGSRIFFAPSKKRSAHFAPLRKMLAAFFLKKMPAQSCGSMSRAAFLIFYLFASACRLLIPFRLKSAYETRPRRGSRSWR